MYLSCLLIVLDRLDFVLEMEYVVNGVQFLDLNLLIHPLICVLVIDGHI